MEQENFLNALSRAQALINDEGFNRLVETKAGSRRKNGGSIGDSEIAGLDAMVFGNPSTSKGNAQYSEIPVASQRKISKSKLPKEILESFAQNPTPDGFFEGQSKMEGLDKLLGLNAGTQQINEQQQYHQVQRPIQQQPQYTQGGPQIDYDYIKFLIKEAVSEAMKTNLNESVGMNGMRGMCIGEGNVIQFLDKKGNVYEGKLVLKKRAK